MTVHVESHNAAIEHLIENDPIERYRIGDASLSISLVKVKTLSGDVQVFVDQIGDGSIIKLFNQTPYPEKPSDVICPHFLELKWANGCFFNCAWCYLNGTFRFTERGKKPHLKNPDNIIQHIESFFDQWKRPTLLNSGELADSLVFEGHTFSLSKNIVPLFKGQNVHKLLVLTKSTNIKCLIESNSQDVVIPSFSLNAYNVAERWESGAPHPNERIAAAQQLFEADYEVRVRIDPMVPVEKWREAYLELLDQVFSSFYPERITLGSLRGLQSTINNCRDKSWVQYLTSGPGTNWGKKIKDSIRYDMNRTIIDYLEYEYSYDRVALCKETVKLWEKLKLDYKKIKCNCLL